MKANNILIVSEAPIDSLNGFGVTLKNFFKNWPTERYRNIYTDNNYTTEFKNIPSTICAHLPLGHARRNWALFILGIKPEWRGKYSKIWLRRKLRFFEPCVVYNLFYSLDCLYYAHWLSETFRIPFIAHVADDPFNGNINQKTRQIFEGADKLFSISDTMAEHYKRISDLEFITFHNGADDSFFQERLGRKINQSFKIRFIGSYYEFLHQDAVKDLVAFIDSYRPQELSILLEFWGNEHPENSLEKYSNEQINVCGNFDNFDKVKLHQEADLLFIPASFDETSKNHYQYSFPTKLTECLASGTPTMIYGPKEMGSVQFCKKNDLGIVLDEKSIPLLKDKISDVVTRYDYYQDKAKKDRQFIKNHYSSKVIRRNFQTILLDTINKS